MSAVKPRMAVAYHFFKDFDTTAAINDRIRTTYGGPLSLAEDFMVWNITKDEITTRMAVVEEATWAPPGTMPAIPPNPSDRDAFSERLGWKLPFSEFIAAGKWDVDDVLRPIYEEAGKATGREFKYPCDE